MRDALRWAALSVLFSYLIGKLANQIAILLPIVVKYVSYAI